MASPVASRSSGFRTLISKFQRFTGYKSSRVVPLKQLIKLVNAETILEHIRPASWTATNLMIKDTGVAECDATEV
jgi:hypothetical protein